MRREDTTAFTMYEGPQASHQAFSAARVNRVIRTLAHGAETKHDARRLWLKAIATRVTAARPDIAVALLDTLDVEPDLEGRDYLRGLSIGEVGVCYEALLSEIDRDHRKSSGQFFTPDDAAQFMSRQSIDFPPGIWLDPCCGVGNLSWHLSSVQPDPQTFIRESLTLIDLDETALKTAVALIAADFAAPHDTTAVASLANKAFVRNFLVPGDLPEHDFIIFNPPYARADPIEGYTTASSRDLFAFFMEKVSSTSRGFIAVTPASYLSIPKFRILRETLNINQTGGDVYVFDNVPDTLFRGYKFGSNNTSKTNFVRAAVTVCVEGLNSWRVTPILRWQAAARETMFAECRKLLAPRRIGPHGEWAKIGPALAQVWDQLSLATTRISDLITSDRTPYALDVGLTPRYYISATYRTLDRRSKATLYFRTPKERDRAALVLNSSIPYIWWRTLDGGVTLPRRILMSVPVPDSPSGSAQLVDAIQASEDLNVVIKMNAGRKNENVKHSACLTRSLNQALIPDAGPLELLYANSMFPLPKDVG